MTQRIGQDLRIEVEDDRVCQDCGKTAECRPYGPGGTDVCFDCGMKDEDGATARMFKALDL